MANMIGAGVLISAGYMVQSMHAGALMIAWAIGLGLALCGAYAYAALASSITRSGGEYRYLSDLFHPIIGNMAGWGSLLIGFSGPIAIDAIAIGWFGQALGLPVDPVVLATGLIIALAAVHGLQWRVSTVAQNVLVVIKVLLVLGLVTVGLSFGTWQWPDWTPTEPATSFWGPIIENQFWIAFAFSGWNAGIYASGEFRKPSRDVPRAMLLGCAVVGILYLAINWIFVANLDPASAQVVFNYGTDGYITLAHVLVDKLLGPGAAVGVSVVVIIALTSAMSAMMLVGPRVYAEMAEDGCLPAFMRSKTGHPPLVSTLLQAAIALVLVHTHSVLEAVQNSSAVLMLFTALAVLGVWVMWFKGKQPGALALVSATLYFGLVSWILWYGLSLKGNGTTIVLFLTMFVLAGASTLGLFKGRKTSPS